MSHIMYDSGVFTPQFMAPVAIVLICALFVFIFGFKHVSEPSFNFSTDDNEKKKRHGKTKKTKSQSSNGHVAHLESAKQNDRITESTVTKPVVEKEKGAAEKPKESMAKKQQVQPALKSSTQPKSSAAEGNTEGGWTTASSKKTKKKKAEVMPEVHVSGGAVGGLKAEPQAVAVSQEKLKASSKQTTKPNKSKPTPKEEIAADVAAETPVTVEKTPATTNAAKKTNEATTKQTASTTNDAKKTNEASTKQTSAANLAKETNDGNKKQGEEAQPATPSKKSKKKKAAAAENGSGDASSVAAQKAQEVNAAEARLQETKTQQKARSKAKKKAAAFLEVAAPTMEMQIEEAMRESPQLSPIEPELTTAASTKSSQKKNKAAVNTEATKTESSHEAPGPAGDSSETRTGAAKPAVPTAAKAPEPKKDYGSADSTDVQDLDWQEAKVNKKRKKARRDN